MAPRQKISRDELLVCAFEIAKNQGIEYVTSRNVAHAAGCSVQPVFYHFPSMDILRQETYLYACRKCGQELLDDHPDENFLPVIVHWMVDMAENQPNLFKLLYLSDMCGIYSRPKSPLYAQQRQRMIQRVSETHHLSLKDSEDILIRGFMFLLGLCIRLCTYRIDMSEKQILEITKKTIDDLIRGIQCPA